MSVFFILAIILGVVCVGLAILASTTDSYKHENVAILSTVFAIFTGFAAVILAVVGLDYATRQTEFKCEKDGQHIWVESDSTITVDGHTVIVPENVCVTLVKP